MSRHPEFISRLDGPVLVIGTGLLGTSLGLALSRAGVEVYLYDISPTSQLLAQDMGAGRLWNGDLPQPALVVVAAPPDVVGELVIGALEQFPEATVTDVASVKSQIMKQVFAHPQAARYVGSHPMAGRESTGPTAADADLFVGRAWVLVKHPCTNPQAALQVLTLAQDVGAFVTELDAKTHDQAVALISHVPQLLSSILAGCLVNAPSTSLNLAGGGLRDMTRIASSDPRLWTAITTANAPAVVKVLKEIVASCTELIDGLAKAPVEPPTGVAQSAVHSVMLKGNQGVARIPGKHGEAAVHTAELGVLVPDAPGELGRLFNEVGAAGINIEDLRIEHSVGQRVGLAWLTVHQTKAVELSEYLESRNWQVIPA
ncbi:prephenate dehydrogenase [Boudabousia marimammalium]|uniref:Prephenate dehydrogenase n=1 Tax=Boudabousia marimammalium TaxID=156892 RepID=A0A1Q5PRE3_9ACTO|nr:prephenate dehydrogenase [Boudabousia marimammalium]OKL49980.1 prephenate dehydrogenase [Boudabousia marimammalium]